MAARLSVLPGAYTRARYQADNSAQISRLARLAAEKPGRIRILDPSPLLCPASECAFATAGRPNYFDAHHLTATLAEVLRPLFEPVFRELPATPPRL
jgi:hypothetical protein